MKIEYSEYLEALGEVKHQLLSGKKLKQNQAKYIVDLIMNLETGNDPLMALKHTKLVSIPKGKLSSGFQAAQLMQKSELKKAVELLNGPDYSRCQNLEVIIKKIKLSFKLRSCIPQNDIEKIIFQLLKNGLNPPDTTRYLYALLF